MNAIDTKWPTLRARFVFARRDVRGVRAPLASATKTGVSLRDDLDYSVWNPNSDISNYKLVEPDDFVVGLRSFQHGLSHSEVCGLVSPAYTVLRGRRDIEPRYYKYYFRSALHIAQLASITQGIRQGQAIDMEAFVDLPFPVPAVEEQRRIADFLDVETAKLDELLKLMKEQEELLDGKRNAVLARSWGEGKASLRRVGYFLKVVTSGPRGWGDYVSDQGIMFFRSANLRRNSIDPNLTALTFVDLPSNVAAESRRSRVQNGDVLMGITGANTGWVAHATSEMVGASVSQHVCLIRPGEKMHGRWLAYFLASPQVQEILLGSQYGGTKQQLSLPDLRDLDSPQLSFSDQIRISAKLDEAIAVLETEQRLRRRQVELLQERRRALITAAVTGELDVTTARGI